MSYLRGLGDNRIWTQPEVWRAPAPLPVPQTRAAAVAGNPLEFRAPAFAPGLPVPVMPPVRPIAPLIRSTPASSLPMVATPRAVSVMSPAPRPPVPSPLLLSTTPPFVYRRCDVPPSDSATGHTGVSGSGFDWDSIPWWGWLVMGTGAFMLLGGRGR